MNSAAILFHQLQISLLLPNVSACRLQSSKRETSSFVVSLLPCLRDPSSRSISETRLVPRGEVVGGRVSAVSLGSFRLPAILRMMAVLDLRPVPILCLVYLCRAQYSGVRVDGRVRRQVWK